MKLYEVKRNTYIRFKGERLFFVQIDGMYSICKDEKGNFVHIAAYSEVEAE